MSRIVLRNTTCYPDDEVARLVRFAFADLELPSRNSIVVRVSHTRLSEGRKRHGGKYKYGASGLAYPYVFVKPDTPKGAAYEVHLRIGKPGDFPCQWYDRGYLGVEVGELRDWRDALIAIAAHEGKHVEGYQRQPYASKRQRRRVLSGYAEEARCDAAAASAIRRWRGVADQARSE